MIMKYDFDFGPKPWNYFADVKDNLFLSINRNYLNKKCAKIIFSLTNCCL